MTEVSNVVGLRGGSVKPPGEADPDVVAALEQFLEMARSGDLKGCVVAVLHYDETVSGSRAGEQDYRLTGLVMQMVHDMCAKRGCGR